MFGVGPVPADDVVVSCEPAFLFEVVDGSTMPPPLEPHIKDAWGGFVIVSTKP